MCYVVLCCVQCVTCVVFCCVVIVSYVLCCVNLVCVISCLSFLDMRAALTARLPSGTRPFRTWIFRRCLERFARFNIPVKVSMFAPFSTFLSDVLSVLLIFNKNEQNAWDILKKS